MPFVARIGDVAGGTIINGATTVTANGIPLAQLGSAVAPHGKSPHSGNVITNGSNSVTAEGIPVARLGDIASCGHAIANASTDVTAG